MHGQLHTPATITNKQASTPTTQACTVAHAQRSAPAGDDDGEVAVEQQVQVFFHAVLHQAEGGQLEFRGLQAQMHTDTHGRIVQMAPP